MALASVTRMSRFFVATWRLFGLLVRENQLKTVVFHCGHMLARVKLGRVREQVASLLKIFPLR